MSRRLGEYKRLTNAYESEDELQRFNESRKSFHSLKREIGIFSGTCLVIATMIGSGIFIVPTGVLKYSQGDVVFCLIGWIIGGIITLTLALCLCELGTTFPESGSYLVYLHKLYGPMWSFVYAWLFIGISNPEGYAAQIIALGEYAMRLYSSKDDGCSIPNETAIAKLIGLIVALFILYINIKNVKIAVKLQVKYLIYIHFRTIWSILLSNYSNI